MTNFGFEKSNKRSRRILEIIETKKNRRPRINALKMATNGSDGETISAPIIGTDISKFRAREKFVATLRPFVSSLERLSIRDLFSLFFPFFIPSYSSGIKPSSVSPTSCIYVSAARPRTGGSSVHLRVYSR